MIPELLFSGVIVKLDKLHKNNLSSYEYVPIIGDIMTTRWAFEAIAVEQFKNNKYEHNFFFYDMGMSQNNWYSSFLIQSLKIDLQMCMKNKNDLNFKPDFNNNLYKINYYTDELNKMAGFGPINGKWKETLIAGSIDSATTKAAGRYLDSLARHLIMYVY